MPSPPGINIGRAAWTDADLEKSPHTQADKPERVRSMFAAIAGKYDLNNRVHSLWMDQGWRKFAVRQAAVKPTDDVLDVACGTGDLSEWFVRVGAKRVTGLDFTAEMLEIARKKASRKGVSIDYVQGDAQQLPYPDASFDIVSIAFGIRNVQDTARAISEFRRVLRPGGRLVILEFAEPKNPVVRRFNNLYCKGIMPRTATWISGDRSGAYKYLPKSVSTFVTPDEMKVLLATSGFAPDVSATSLSMGICMCYLARVP